MYFNIHDIQLTAWQVYNNTHTKHQASPLSNFMAVDRETLKMVRKLGTTEMLEHNL